MTSGGNGKQRRTSQTSSIASSIRSTNSDQSYDSSAIPETEPLVRERGPPPAYSPPAAPVARPAYVPVQSIAERSEGRTYGTISVPSRSYDADLYEESEDADEEDNNGDEQVRPEDSSGAHRSKKSKRRTCWSRRCVRTTILIFTSVLVGLLVCYALGHIRPWSENAVSSTEVSQAGFETDK